MCKCGRKNCIGYILLHIKELDKLESIKQKQLKKDPNYVFDLTEVKPFSIGDDRFRELHILKGECNNA